VEKSKGESVEAERYTGFEKEIRDRGVAWITFNEPDRLNAMTQAFKRDLVEVVLQLQMDESVRVVVFTGSGKAFSVGDDISSEDSWSHGKPTLVPRLPPGHSDALSTYNGLRTMSQAVNIAVRNIDKPTIAAINGFAVHCGFSLALSCDFRIASSTSKMGSGTLRFGLLPDEGGHWLVVQTLGPAKALDFLLRPRIISADEALNLGFVNEVVSPEKLLQATSQLADELANGPQIAQRILKRLVYRAIDQTFEQACDDIAIRTGISDFHPDVTEGLSAFREKRPPRFA
jgi:2-(1,2-epoxy-1,2-dihydrophenyl)acetyl-CoA isomerase